MGDITETGRERLEERLMAAGRPHGTHRVMARYENVKHAVPPSSGLGESVYGEKQAHHYYV